MSEANHYAILQVTPSASQEEIKQAYRRLVKQFHPDINPDGGSREQIIEINAAYEVLGDIQSRKRYDNRLRYTNGYTNGYTNNGHRGNPTNPETNSSRRPPQRSGKDEDALIAEWIRLVYQPVNRIISKILKSLKAQIEKLAADPFDDDLLEAFQDYLDLCRDQLKSAQNSFRSRPNPASMARAAAHLYYSLNQISDALDELAYFPTSYDENYLHNGSEMFRIARQLHREAQESVKSR